MNIVKTAAIAILALAALVPVGCGPAKPPALSGEHNTLSASDIAVSLQAPKRFYDVGEKLTAVVTIQNLTDQPLTISANSGANVFVRVWRHTSLGEVEVKQYPQFATMVMRDWTLQPHEIKNFPMELSIEPDWPRGELLRLTGEVNGRPQLQPGIAISINLDPSQN